MEHYIMIYYTYSLCDVLLNGMIKIINQLITLNLLSIIDIQTLFCFLVIFVTLLLQIKINQRLQKSADVVLFQANDS